MAQRGGRLTMAIGQWASRAIRRVTTPPAEMQPGGPISGNSLAKPPAIGIDTRNQIDMLRILLIAGLVCLHFGSFPGSDVSPFRGMVSGPHAIASFVNSYVLFFFLSAVPLLSAISGYLFFRDSDFSTSFYFRRWRSRVTSIFLPMVSWNAIVLLLFAGVALIDPTTSVLGIVKYDVLHMTIPDWANALIGVTRHPINFQFWFLRDLLLTILFAPLLGILLSRLPFLGLAGLFAVWIGSYTLGIFFRTDVLFFFYVGALLNVRGWNVRTLAPKVAMAALALYAILVAARTAAPLAISDTSLIGDIVYGPLSKLLRVLGVVTAWSVAPLLLRTQAGSVALKISSVAFFLHAIHWPLNQFVKVALAKIVGTDSNGALLFIYVTTIAVTIALALIAAHALSRYAPAVFKHLSGGRNFSLGAPRKWRASYAV
jgi:hypothetical protein